MKIRLAIILSLAGLMLAAGCALRQPRSQEHTAYRLDAGVPAAPAKNGPGGTLLVAPMRAGAGFESSRMAYVLEANRIDYFAYSRWVDAPARMLTPLVVRAVEAGAAFDAVVQGPSAVAAQWRLETELIELMQDFTAKPSVVRLRLRAQVVEMQTQRVRAARLFELRAGSVREDAGGGVAALNAALPALLTDLSTWTAQASRP